MTDDSKVWHKLLSEEDRAALAIGRREWNQLLSNERRALRALKGDAFVSAAIAHLLKFSSERRARKMLSLVRDQPANVFWRIFLAVWSNCDDTWSLRGPLLERLRSASAEVSATEYLGDADRTAFDSLPAEITIYRGCSKQRINGLSWSTNRVVAQGFARGHREIPVPEPVLVTALAKKEEILAVNNGRRENELICVPYRILRVDDLTPTQTTNLASGSNKPLC
jgi:hypothetical protein